MSYTYNGTVYSITSPVSSISINKLNIVVKDQAGSKFISFTDVKESKQFLTWLYQV